MQKELKITINGKAYPCRLTMGAMLRFKEVTGREYTEMQNTLSDMCAFIWALLKSAAQREKIPFEYDFMDFCDSVDPEEIANGMAVYAQSVVTDDKEQSTEKKTD